MSNFIHMKNQQPINLDLIGKIKLRETMISFDPFDLLTSTAWHFENSKQAKTVYLAILATQSKDIGQTELTLEEIRSINEM